MDHFKRVSVAIAFAGLALGSAADANASVSASGTAYAAARLLLRNAVVTTSGATFTFGPSVTTSYDSATLNGFNQSDTGATSALPANAPGSIAPFLRSIGDFTVKGPSLAGNYATSAAHIFSQQALGDPSTAASDVAEINLANPGSASAFAGNRFTTDFAVAGAGGVLSFTFEANPFLEIANLGGASTATAALVFSIKIVTASGSTVFSWSPDGVTSNATGGTDFADSEDLNRSISANGAFSSNGDVSFTLFGARTSAGVLLPGSYTLIVDMPDFVSAVAVPEPDGVALMGIGLVGLLSIAGMNRRKGRDHPTTGRPAAHS